MGDRLKDHATYREMLDEEGRRCWTLVYADSAKFHLDTLPAIPNADYKTVLKNLGVQNGWADSGIALTDTSHPNYDKIDPNWPRGNPKGYGMWFRARMITQFEARHSYLAKSLKAEIDDVPEYKVKTPLQQGIQLFKRHRDLAFENKDDKPASIVITTLAALAYNNEIDIVEAFVNMLDGMLDHIELRDGKPWIQNPVDPLENFVDRWQDRPGREQDFLTWHRNLREEVHALLECRDLDRIIEMLTHMFGERVALSAVNRYKEHSRERKVQISTVSPFVNPNKPWGI